jgi:hypothetical protein
MIMEILKGLNHGGDAGFCVDGILGKVNKIDHRTYSADEARACHTPEHQENMFTLYSHI